MNIVVDTNIVFSTLLNPNSTIGEILMNIQDDVTFFAPELLKSELERYLPKIVVYSKIDSDKINDTKQLVLAMINFIQEEDISEKSWIKAFELTNDIDADDTPFVALAIELKTLLWSGDKVLTNGLIKKGADVIITTADLKNSFINS